jgi:hypothetical protein
MKLIFICSPFAGDIEINTLRARRYARFAYIKGYVPYAPHLHNPQFLSEDISVEREAGITLGIEILSRADELWCFGEVLTSGMEEELRYAYQNDVPIKYFTEKCEEIIERTGS